METVIRVVVIYVFLLVGLRILGKREFSQLSALELVALLLVPEMVSNALQSESASITNGFIGITTLFTLVFLTSAVMHLSEKASIVVSGQPVVLVHRGHLMVDSMNKERVSPDEIYNSLHESGLERIAQVKWAILESDGKISIVPEDSAGGSSQKADTSDDVR